jgi:hypothetical protein
VFLNLGHRSDLGRLTFNEDREPVDQAAVDLVHGLWTYSIDLSLEK